MTMYQELSIFVVQPLKNMVNPFSKICNFSGVANFQIYSIPYNVIWKGNNSNRNLSFLYKHCRAHY